MSNIWEEYKHIRCGDFLRWWSEKTAEEKLEWRKEKDKIDEVYENRFYKLLEKGK
jgi:uncharacterized protein (DUF924 family)